MLVQRVVAGRFVDHAEHNKLLLVKQSAYRQHHNTESAVVSVMNNIVRSIDDGKVVPLVLLDLSAAFYPVDYRILLEVLHYRFSVSDISPFVVSFVSDQQVTVNQCKWCSIRTKRDLFSVAQGSVLESIEFIAYTDDVVKVFHSNSVHHHLFAALLCDYDC